MATLDIEYCEDGKKPVPKMNMEQLFHIITLVL
jgi:hypothetical protein